MSDEGQSQKAELSAPTPGPSADVNELLGWLAAGREAIAAFQQIRAIIATNLAHETIVNEIRRVYADFDEKHPQLANKAEQ